jgi:hypothetical protein
MGRLLTGFVAAMLSVLLFHQPTIAILKAAGMLPPTSQIYNMAPLGNALPAVAGLFKSIGFGGWPTLFNQLFWGGLLGALFGLIHHKLPGGLMLLKGLVFGLIVVVLSNWLLVPLIKGQPIFAGFVPQRLMAGAIIQAAFGTGLGLIYGLMRRNT